MTRGRLEAFSDGVLAIIITIMVLEIKVPRQAPTLADLRPLLPVFLSYVLSFVYIGIYWNNHHHMLQATPRISGGVLWANLHLMFWLSLVPFATAWMGQNDFAPATTALYGFMHADGGDRLLPPPGGDPPRARGQPRPRIGHRPGPQGQALAGRLHRGDRPELRRSMDRLRAVCAGRGGLADPGPADRAGLEPGTGRGVGPAASRRDRPGRPAAPRSTRPAPAGPTIAACVQTGRVSGEPGWTIGSRMPTITPTGRRPVVVTPLAAPDCGPQGRPPTVDRPGPCHPPMTMTPATEAGRLAEILRDARHRVDEALGRFVPDDARRATTARPGWPRRCGTACSAAASGSGRCSGLLAAEACGGDPRRGAAGGLRRGDGPHLFADPRRPAGMDDDDLRRGRPTCHKAFDEATAILAGDGLLTLAFEVDRPPHPPARGGGRGACWPWPRRPGPTGMVGGQMADLQAEGRDDADDRGPGGDPPPQDRGPAAGLAEDGRRSSRGPTGRDRRP